MNASTKQEHAGDMLGVKGLYFSVIAADSGRILNQQFKASRTYYENGHTYRITVKVRFDDGCNNGHETFTITADVREDEQEYMGGCCHDEIAKRFPELAPLIKWHLTSTDGPMHYIANTVYRASDKDCHGLRKGESRQIRNGKTGVLCWILESVGSAERYIDSKTQPVAPEFYYAPWNRVSEGKVRELDHARSAAIWPEATDGELTAPGLKERLVARFPALMAAFKFDMVAAGFTWPAPR